MAEFRRVNFVLRSPTSSTAEITASVESLARSGEKLVMDGRTYRVELVLHNYDNGDVFVYADDT